MTLDTYPFLPYSVNCSIEVVVTWYLFVIAGFLTPNQVWHSIGCETHLSMAITHISADPACGWGSASEKTLQAAKGKIWKKKRKSKRKKQHASKQEEEARGKREKETDERRNLLYFLLLLLVQKATLGSTACRQRGPSVPHWHGVSVWRGGPF